jgi:putative restriction endonuclease
VLDQDVQMDLVGPLACGHVIGRFEASVEAALRARPARILTAARDLVLSNFPATLAPDVLEAAGLDPREVLGAGAILSEAGVVPGERRRDSGWRFAVLEAWDRQCCRRFWNFPGLDR